MEAKLPLLGTPPLSWLGTDLWNPWHPRVQRGPCSSVPLSPGPAQGQGSAFGAAGWDEFSPEERRRLFLIPALGKPLVFLPAALPTLPFPISSLSSPSWRAVLPSSPSLGFSASSALAQPHFQSSQSCSSSSPPLPRLCAASSVPALPALTQLEDAAGPNQAGDVAQKKTCWGLALSLCL